MECQIKSRLPTASEHFCEFGEANQRPAVRSDRIYAVSLVVTAFMRFVSRGACVRDDDRAKFARCARNPHRTQPDKSGYYERGGRRLTSQKVRVGSLDRWLPGNGSMLSTSASPTEPKNPTGKNHIANQSGF